MTARRSSAILTVVMGLALAQVPIAPAAPGVGLTFGVILVGPHNDHGWSEAHYIASQYAEKKVAGAKMIYVDNVNPGAKRA